MPFKRVYVELEAYTQKSDGASRILMLAAEGVAFPGHYSGGVCVEYQLLAIWLRRDLRAATRAIQFFLFNSTIAPWIYAV